MSFADQIPTNPTTMKTKDVISGFEKLTDSAKAAVRRKLQSSAPDLLDALRRMLVATENRTQGGLCIICGQARCFDDCAVENARRTLAPHGPEFDDDFMSPVPPYDPKTDGDYSSFLALHNCD